MAGLIDRLKALQKRLEAPAVNMQINDAIRQVEDLVLQMVKAQMYERGIMDINKPSDRLKYSEAYKKRKAKRATYKKVEFITLRYDGDLYDRMKIIYFKDKVLITTDDLKWANYLEKQERFANAIGLTEENLDKLREMVRNELINNFRKWI